MMKYMFIQLLVIVCMMNALNSSSVLVHTTNGHIETDYKKLVNMYANAEWRDEFMAMVEVKSGVIAGAGEGEGGGEAKAGAQGGKGTESSLVGACEVCVYVVENKEQHQPYLCRGLKDPNYQKNCVQVMESLMWWLTNEVYWLNYGCQRSMNGAVEWVRPCPAHAVCSWIEQLYTRQPYCPQDPYYKKPQ